MTSTTHQDQEAVPPLPSEEAEAVTVQPSEEAEAEAEVVQPSEEAEAEVVQPSEEAVAVAVQSSEEAEAEAVQPSEEAEAEAVQPSEEAEAEAVQPSEEAEAMVAQSSQEVEAVAAQPSEEPETAQEAVAASAAQSSDSEEGGAAQPMEDGESPQHMDDNDPELECCFFSLPNFPRERELMVLFLTYGCNPVTFCTNGLPRRDRVERAIKNNGGGVTDDPHGQHTVVLAHTDKRVADCEVRTDQPFCIFSDNYIWDCVRDRRLHPLTNYWVNKPVDFDGDNYNPYDVMVGKLTWNDCKKEIKSSPSAAAGASGRNLDDELFYNFDDLTKPTRSKFRLPYTHKDRIMILQYLKKNQSSHRIHGNAVWKEMERDKVCTPRTWQSMKEHFKKYILHHLDQYPLGLTRALRENR